MIIDKKTDKPIGRVLLPHGVEFKAPKGCTYVPFNGFNVKGEEATDKEYDDYYDLPIIDVEIVE